MFSPAHRPCLTATRHTPVLWLSLAVLTTLLTGPLRSWVREAIVFAEPQEVPNAPHEAPIAMVLERPILSQELLPEESLRQEKANDFTPEDYQKWLARFRRRRLVLLIGQPLVAYYLAQHRLDPTDSEVATAMRALRQRAHDDEALFEQQRQKLLKQVAAPGLNHMQRESLTQRLHAIDAILTSVAQRKQPLSPDQIASQLSNEREQAWQLVRAWKFYRAIYAQYGGTVVWQQTGLEPLSAYRQFLAEQWQQRVFRIDDPELRTLFWEYWLTDHPTALNDDELKDFLRETHMKHPFDKPWWLIGSL